MWGSIIGSIIGATASTVNQKMAQDHSAEQAALASERSLRNSRRFFRFQAMEGPSLMRYGLERAGYNPLLAVNGGMSMPSASVSSSPKGDAFVPDIVGSAKQGAELSRDLVNMFGEQVEQAETKTKADKKGLEVIDAQKEKIETETDVLKSQEIRNWVDSFGGFIDDGINGLILWNLLNDRRKRNSVFSKKAARNLGSSSSSNSSGGDSLLPIFAPLLFNTVKGSLPIAIGASLYEGGNRSYPEYSKEVKKNVRKQISNIGLPVVY